MSNIAIKVENLSKAYQLGEIGTGTISRDLERWVARMRGKEDPFLKIGETNDRSTKGTSDMVWSLKDINFEIEQGDAVGIIGRNGAGKSTLLKILSRVTSPTTGKITGKGRIASLLEVGTGFHPELTGRENIYLNGAILGMRKKEIARKFDEIVAFAGVERYVDTPVKRYSSGMYVRLAFAVAAHLESEILIVDEVLAVGDAEFQKKCLGKMGEVSKGEGRTVLFVSHNMDAVTTLTTKSIYLSNGVLTKQGKTEDVISNYYNSNETSHIFKKLNSTKKIFFKEISTSALGFSINSSIEFDLNIFSEIKLSNVAFGIGIFNSLDKYVGNIIVEKAASISVGDNFLKIIISNHNLVPNNYKGVFAIAMDKTFHIYDTVLGNPSFKVFNEKEDVFLLNKWDKQFGDHFLSNVKIEKFN